LNWPIVDRFGLDARGARYFEGARVNLATQSPLTPFRRGTPAMRINSRQYLTETRARARAWPLVVGVFDVPPATEKRREFQ